MAGPVTSDIALSRLTSNHVGTRRANRKVTRIRSFELRQRRTLVAARALLGVSSRNFPGRHSLAGGFFGGTG